MYSRSESGLGIARNLASHSRSAFAASAEEPGRSRTDEGAAARKNALQVDATSARAIRRIRSHISCPSKEGALVPAAPCALQVRGATPPLRDHGMACRRRVDAVGGPVRRGGAAGQIIEHAL